jgi:hypothetical protein
VMQCAGDIESGLSWHGERIGEIRSLVMFYDRLETTSPRCNMHPQYALDNSNRLPRFPPISSVSDLSWRNEHLVSSLRRFRFHKESCYS